MLKLCDVNVDPSHCLWLYLGNRRGTNLSYVHENLDPDGIQTPHHRHSLPRQNPVIPAYLCFISGSVGSPEETSIITLMDFLSPRPPQAIYIPATFVPRMG